MAGEMRDADLKLVRERDGLRVNLRPLRALDRGAVPYTN
jgi:hypothetical protein